MSVMPDIFDIEYTVRMSTICPLNHVCIVWMHYRLLLSGVDVIYLFSDLFYFLTYIWWAYYTNHVNLMGRITYSIYIHVQ